MTNSIDEINYKDSRIKVTYDHSSSLTGRSKCFGNVNFLTMKKSERRHIKSKYKNGKIIELDIKSLEPRVMCKINNLKLADDIYTYIASNIIFSEKKRKDVKLGILAIIYGANFKTVSKLSGLSQSESIKIKSYLKVDELNRKLKRQYEINNHIKNYYNRPIFSKDNSALVNHYIQSTAADCAQLAFYNYLKNIDHSKFNLIAVIHDAVILDVHPDMCENIIATPYIYESRLDIKLPLKSEVINE